MLAIAEVRQRDNQNAHHLVETSSFHEDITKDDMPLDDELSLSSITSRAYGSDPRGEAPGEVVTGGISRDTLADSLSDITKPRGDFETKKGGILDSVLRFSWGRRGRSTKTNTSRDRSKSRSTSRQRRKPKERYAIEKKIQSRDDRVGPLDIFLQTNTNNTDFSISPDSEVSEGNPA